MTRRRKVLSDNVAEVVGHGRVAADSKARRVVEEGAIVVVAIEPETVLHYAYGDQIDASFEVQETIGKLPSNLSVTTQNSRTSGDVTVVDVTFEWDAAGHYSGNYYLKIMEAST